MSLFADTKTPGRFGRFGGRFVPETLMANLLELERAFEEIRGDQTFRNELDRELREFVGRPTALTEARRLSAAWGGRVFLKREDLCHTGAHKINNALAQVLLAKRLGRRRIVAETGAGQHGVATAAACARAGLECIVFMGEKDCRRQAPNLHRMALLGAKVVGVGGPDGTLKSAVNEAIRHWMARPDDTHYLLGSAVGPHPFPAMVREFQSVIGREARRQMLEREGALPDAVVACVGGGSNAIGLFAGFLDDPVELIGVEAAGARGGALTSATLGRGRPGVLHGSFSFVLQDDDGQILPTGSVAAGLDYPGVGPEHAFLQESGRARYVSVHNDEALAAFHETCRLEGILPALESSHALAFARRLLQERPGQTVLVNLSGRGDKDMASIEASEGGRDANC